MKENVLVFGVGYLGNRIAETLNFRLTDFRVCDRISLEKYLCEEKPEIVINAIGKTGRPNIDWCETHKKETVFGNVSVPLMLAQACLQQGIYFVNLGSGCVYNGDNNGRGFSETDIPNFRGPQFYAITKIRAEEALSEFPCLQLRIRMPIDDRSHERNLIDKLKNYPRVIDVQNSMTTVPHMIPAIQKLIEKKAQGIYNLTNPGTTSACEIMLDYKHIVDGLHKFEVFSLKELGFITLARRSNCMLDTGKLQREGIFLPEIHEAVKECLFRYKQRLAA